MIWDRFFFLKCLFINLKHKTMKIQAKERKKKKKTNEKCIYYELLLYTYYYEVNYKNAKLK